MKNVIIIINRFTSKQENLHILSLAQESAKIYHTENVKNNFFDTRMHYISLDNKIKKRINEEIMNEVNEFGDMQIDSKSLSDLLSHENFSLWHYYKFRTYFEVRNIVYEIEILKSLQNDSSKIYYYTDTKILNTVFPSDKIVYCFPEKRTDSGFNYFQLLKYSLFFIARVIFGFKRIKRIKNKQHLIIDQSKKQQILDIETLKTIKGNYNLSYLFSKIDNQFLIIDDVSFPEKKTGYKFTFETYQFSKKHNRIYGESIIFSSLLNKKYFYETNKIYAFFREKLNNVETSLFSDTEKLIYQVFKKNTITAKLFIFKYVSYKYFFQKQNFSTISTIDENSPLKRCVLDAAKFNNITTIGIQHGAIHYLHPAYRYTKNDQAKRVATDYTLIWGEKWKQILQTTCNYNNSSLVITGQIRTDIIPKLLSSSIPVKELKGLEHKSIILFASQPQRDRTLRYKTAKDIFNSVKNLNNTHLLIKLHPGEFNDLNYYHQIAKETGTTNYSVIYWIDLYLVLSKSSVVITSFSTVGAETVYFKKPLIIVDYLKQDLQNYYKEGVAFQATSQPEIEKLIIELMDNRITIDNNAYNNFIKRNAYAIDGNVCNRVIGFIKTANQ